MENENICTGILNDASVSRVALIDDELKLKNWYDVECYDSNGNLKWSDRVYNLVTTAGFNDILTQYFKGSSYTAAWYVGLVDGGSTPTYSAADTSSSHAGWTESTAYSESVRQTLTLGSASSGSISNTASKAVFSINGTATIAGCFVITDNTKSGTTGTLYGEGNFSGGNKSVASGDTLNVTVTLTAS
jgi:hypothetical protein